MSDTLQRPASMERSDAAILEAAEIVIARLGHDKLTLAEIARVSLIPLARIYQFFPDRNAILGALSARALARISAAVDTRGTWSAELDESQRIERIIDRFSGMAAEPSSAYLVLCGPFDAVSEESRQDAVARLAATLRHALDSGSELANRSDEALGYAAELVFACLRRSFLMDGRVTASAVGMAQHAVHSFVASGSNN